MENDAISMFLLVQNKFAFTPSRNALIIIMKIPRSIQYLPAYKNLFFQI